MAANYLTIGSRFRPFSYDELIAPIIAAEQEHQRIENEYADLAVKSNVWEEMANEQTDPYAYNMYKTYSNDLEKQADQLVREGLTPASRQNMLRMKQRYSSDIIPIEQAYKRRQELIDEQRKLLAQDNTLMFDRNASMLSLDDLIRNPQLTYQSYSGATLAKQVGTAAQNLAKAMRDNPRKWNEILNSQYFETMMQQGYTPEEILLASVDNKNAPEELRNIVEDAITSSGIRNWNDRNTLNRAYEYARQGLWNAVGETKYQVQTNRAYDYIMRAGATEQEPEDNSLYYRTVNKTTVDGSKKTTQMDEDLKVLQEVLNDPSLLSKQSKRTVREPKYFSPDPMTSLIMDSGLGETREETYYPYQEKLEELSKRYGDINYTITDGRLSGGNLAELAQQLSNDIRSSAVRSFIYVPNITQSDLITQVLKEDVRTRHNATDDTGLWEIKDNGKRKKVDIEDLNKYFTSDANIGFDPDLGFILYSTDSKGETRTAVLDTELFDNQSRTFSGAQQSIEVALENGEDELATILIEAMMKAFYERFNTLEKRQSNTTSKEKD